jgi:hypothetical protein
LSIFDCPFGILWIFHFFLPLRFSLDCSFLIAPSVFSGLFIFDCPFGILWVVHFLLPLWYSLTFIYILPLIYLTWNGLIIASHLLNHTSNVASKLAIVISGRA